jgi:hypothetical protein
MMLGFLRNIPDSNTPGIDLIFPDNCFGFFIIPKSASKIILPFSEKNG